MKSRYALLAALVAAHLSYAEFPPQIKNVIVIIQENRSPDNLFHFLTPACPLPVNADPLDACKPKVAANCYDISPCGLSNKSGQPVPVKLHAAKMDAPSDPGHNHVAFEFMCDPDPATYACRNDGAWRIIPDNFSYTYVENTPVTNSNGSPGHLLDPYLTLAKDYGWANFMYQTNQGASYAAHQFLFAGTSALTAKDDERSTFVSENFVTTSGMMTDAGCTAPANTDNLVISPVIGTATHGCFIFDDSSVQECTMPNSGLVFPTDPVGTFCAQHKALSDLLDAKEASWKYYSPTAGAIWTAPDAIQSICVPKFDPSNPDAEPACTGKEWKAHVDVNNLGTDILRDISSCSMARVSWVTPNATWSDHSGIIGTVYGPSWVAAIVNAIGNNPVCPKGTPDAGQHYWDNTAILVLWDDWGGWSDNQPAPYAGKLPCTSYDCQADYQYGFRVPLIVVSAYTPAGTISNSHFDFGTVLRMIEAVYGIPEGALGFADKRGSGDLHDFFSLTTPRKYKTIPAMKDAGYFLNQTGPAIDPDDD